MANGKALRALSFDASSSSSAPVLFQGHDGLAIGGDVLSWSCFRAVLPALE